MDIRPDVFIEPLSSLSSGLADIAARLEMLRVSHCEGIEAAVRRYKETGREQVASSLRQELDYEFQEGTRIVRAEFEERMRLATQQWEIERKSLMDEIAGLRNSTDQRELTAERAKTEAALSECRQGIEAMVANPAPGVSKLIRETAREAELQAYLKGLKFSQSPSARIPEPVGEESRTALAGGVLQPLISSQIVRRAHEFNTDRSAQ